MSAKFRIPRDTGSRAKGHDGRPAMLAVAAVALLLGACETRVTPGIGFETARRR